MKLVTSRLICVASTAISLGSMGLPSQAAGCFQAPYTCLPQGDINPATPATYAAQYEAYANFVWQDFLSLNFPAATDAFGNPLPRPSTTNGLNYKGGNYTAVWQVYSEANDLFRPGAALPPTFGTGHEIPLACVAKGRGTQKVLRRSKGRILSNENVLAEYIQANRMGPVIDRNGQYVRYGLNFNQDMYNYIVDNNLYSKEGQLLHDINNPDRDKDTVRFPPGTYNGGAPTNPGSTFVKSSWKILGAGDDASKFYRIQAFVYEEKGGAFHDEPTVEEHCSLETVGLVGLHIVHLSNSAPQWVWATFEHVSNAPWLADFSGEVPKGPYSFYNSPSCPPIGGQPGCAYNTLPVQPWNPQIPGQIPNELVRVAAPGEWAIQTNRAHRAQLEAAYGTTVWSNYFLVDVQFPTVVAKLNDGTGKANVNPAYPDGVPSPSQLANTTMETYIQGFHSGQMTSNGNSIPTTDQMQNIVVQSLPVSPFDLNVFNRSGGAERVTSSCLGCHADAAMTTGSSGHLVFSLSRAQATAPAVRKSAVKGSEALDPAAVVKAHSYLIGDKAAKGDQQAK